MTPQEINKPCCFCDGELLPTRNLFNTYYICNKCYASEFNGKYLKPTRKIIRLWSDNSPIFALEDENKKD